MKVCRETKTLLILGPAAGLNILDKDDFKVLNQKQTEEGLKIFCYSSALSCAMNNGLYPDYFMFVDPQTLSGGVINRKYSPNSKKIIQNKNLNILKRVNEINSVLLCWDIIYRGKKAFNQQGFTSKSADWRGTSKFLKTLEAKGLLEVLPVKNLFYSDHIKEDDGLGKWLHTYKEHNEIVVGYPTGIGRDSKKKKSSGADDKLTSSILPVILQIFPVIERIVLLGFGDIDTFRWFHPKITTPYIRTYANKTIKDQQVTALASYSEYFNAHSIECLTLTKNSGSHLLTLFDSIEVKDI